MLFLVSPRLFAIDQVPGHSGQASKLNLNRELSVLSLELADRLLEDSGLDLKVHVR